MISLDGSTLEGGGQLVRVALALSAITSIPVHLYNIRANRAPFGNRRKGHSSSSNNNSYKNGSSRRIEGGLKESHLVALQWLADRTDASVEGAELGSREVKFRPAKRMAGERRATAQGQLRDQGTDCNAIELKKPGSVWLVLQAILPYVVFRRARDEKRGLFILRGGTNVDKSMSGEYVQQVLLPTLRKIGLPANVQVDVVKRGWAGGAAPEIGEVKVSIVAEKGDEQKGEDALLNGFEVVDRGSIEKISVSVVAHPESLRRQVMQRVQQQVNERFDVPVEAVVDDDSGDGTRFYLLLVALTTNGWRIGRDFLGSGARMRNARQVESLVNTSVQRTVRDFDTEFRRGGCVDEHLQDQLAIFQALSRGRNVVDAGSCRGDGTLHTQTVRWVCSELLEVRFGEHGVCERSEG